MIAFTFSDYEHLIAPLGQFADKGNFEVTRFTNGELFINIRTPVRLAHCVVLGSIAPPDERLLSLALLAHTLKKEGSTRVTAFLPYLAYSRQDKDKPGQSLAAAWVGSFLRTSGVDEVVTIDVHSERDKQLFSVPLISTFPAEIFANAIRKHQLTDATIVAPDNGAIPRCQAVNRALSKATASVPYFEKQRDETGIKHTDLCGKVGPRALIIDDMLDTGGTLISACEKLVQADVQAIYIMVTHGLFTGKEWKKLWSLKVQRVFCTETVRPTREALDEPRITILSIGELLGKQLGLLQNSAVMRD